MPGKASTRAQNKYILKAYDRINFTVPKGEKERIKARAEDLGESVNGYIYRLIVEDMATGYKPAFGQIPEYNGIGIYCIKNTDNGKHYVGSSRHVKQRLKEHVSAMRSGYCNKKMLEDVEAGGHFVFSVLEEIAPGCTLYELKEKERAWVAKLDAFPGGYNSPVEGIVDRTRREIVIE